VSSWQGDEMKEREKVKEREKEESEEEGKRCRGV